MTLETYAAAKQLPVTFLRELGLDTVKSPYGKGLNVVAIPYRDRNGTVMRMRFRVAMAGKSKLIWDQQKEKGIGLYGLERLPESAEQIYLVEGESDCHTLWQRGYAALGIPGATNFKPERDDEALTGFEIVALIEPDAGGEAMLARLRKSKHAANIKLARLDGFKDVSELHCKAGDRFDAVLDAAIAEAKPLIEAKSPKPKTAKTRASAQTPEEEDGKRRSQADLLVEIATAEAELFATPGEETAYAAIMLESHREIWPLKARGFKRWLTHRYFLASGKAPNADAMTQALATLDAMASCGGKRAPVFTRRAEQAGKLYLDLCDEAWRAIEIDAYGWRLVERPPVYFTRALGMLPLPVPEHGGSIDELNAFLNVATESDFHLIVAWLLAALRPTGPYPILALTGEGGTAKTSTARLLRSLIDPHAAKVRRPPQSERDLFIGATKTAVLVYDNLSAIADWFSDSLCVIATGGTYAARQLHTDAEEMIFSVCLPVMLTSVGEVIARSDLASRAITVSLATIPDHLRKSEAELERAIERATPRLLGALLDAVSHGISELPNISARRAAAHGRFYSLDPGLRRRSLAAWLNPGGV